MRIDTAFCAKCGEYLSFTDRINNFFDFTFKYGSRRDGEKIKFALCSDCLDDVFDFIFWDDSC